MAKNLYTYKAQVKEIIDGDTVDLTVSLGFHMQFEGRFRLFGINTPESYGKEACEAGKVAKEYLKGLLPPGTAIIVKTDRDKTEKYGRFLATLYLLDPKGVPAAEAVNQTLVKLGHAKPYFGVGQKPV